jgi:hypothetical protein
MRQFQADFSNMVGLRIIPVPTRGQPFTVGEHIAVSDEDTGVYEAIVIEVSGAPPSSTYLAQHSRVQRG